MREPERRRVAVAGLKVEARADGSAGSRIVGHAARFDEWTTLYESRWYVWREIIRPGAFAAAIAEGQDVRALFNHDANWVLGRTAAGTLRLAEDSAGLLMDCDAPDTQLVRDLVLGPIGRGDVSGQSFSFSVRSGDVVTRTDAGGITVVEDGGQRLTIREDGDRTIEEREILACDLYDVGPVTFPAYQTTDVALRSLGARREAEYRGKTSSRGRMARMAMRRRAATAAARLGE